MQSDFDVVIAGAGLVGAALALGLSRLGLQVLVVDKLPPPGAARGPGISPEVNDTRGLALSLSSVAVLEALQVWSRLASLVYPIKHIHVTQQGHFGALRLSHRDLDLPTLGVVCPAEALQRALLVALEDAPGISVHWATRLTACNAEREALQISLVTSTQPTSCTTSLLIGADGIDSQVREFAGIETQRHAYGQTAIVANVDVACPRANTAFERFTTSGPLALLPIGGRRHVLVRTAHCADLAELLALTDAAYLVDARQRFGHTLGAWSNLGPRRAHPLVLQRAARLIGARCMLLGNAANTVHPNAAQGLNLGFRDVAAALTIIENAQRAGEDLGSTPVLQRYAAARAGDQHSTTRITDTLARVFALESPVFGSLRALAILAVDRLPTVKRAILRRLALGQGFMA